MFGFVLARMLGLVTTTERCMKPYRRICLLPKVAFNIKFYYFSYTDLALMSSNYFALIVHSEKQLILPIRNLLL